jgi:hypothetical protein
MKTELKAKRLKSGILGGALTTLNSSSLTEQSGRVPNGDVPLKKVVLKSLSGIQ